MVEPVTSEKNWSLPSDFKCTENCRRVYWVAAEGRHYSFSARVLPNIPVYRHASKKGNTTNILYDHEFDDLRRTIPGFHLRNGFA